MSTHRCVGFLSLVVVICAASPRAAHAVQGGTLDFEPVFSGPIDFDQELIGDHVFHNESSWCAFWSEAFAHASPPPCPAVDFPREVVVAVVTQEGGCSHSEVDSIARLRRNSAEVLVTHFFPRRDSNCTCVASFWQAIEAVAVARPIGHVEFAHESIEFSCER